VMTRVVRTRRQLVHEDPLADDKHLDREHTDEIERVADRNRQVNSVSFELRRDFFQDFAQPLWSFRSGCIPLAFEQ